MGVSRDKPAAVQAFADKYELPYPLISDAEGVIGRALGIPTIAGVYRRITVLADPQGRIAELIEDVDVGRHAEQIQAALNRHG